jgi:hypothetical protein
MNSVYNVIKTYIKKNPTKPQHKMLIILNTEQMTGFDFDKLLNTNFSMVLLEKDGEMVPIKTTY